MGFTGFSRVLLGCTRLNSAGMGFDWVSRALHGFFYWVLLSFS